MSSRKRYENYHVPVSSSSVFNQPSHVVGFSNTTPYYVTANSPTYLPSNLLKMRIEPYYMASVSYNSYSISQLQILLQETESTLDNIRQTKFLHYVSNDNIFSYGNIIGTTPQESVLMQNITTIRARINELQSAAAREEKEKKDKEEKEKEVKRQKLMKDAKDAIDVINFTTQNQCLRIRQQLDRSIQDLARHYGISL